MIELPITLQKNIINFLLSVPNIHDNNTQRALIYHAGLDRQLQDQIQFGKSSMQFVSLLIPVLIDYGKLNDGRYALESILQAAKQFVGSDKQEYCENLLKELSTDEKKPISSFIEFERRFKQRFSRKPNGERNFHAIRFKRYIFSSILTLLIISFAIISYQYYQRTDNEVNQFHILSGTLEVIDQRLGKFKAISNKRPGKPYSIGNFEYVQTVSDNFELSIQIESSVGATSVELAGAKANFGIFAPNNSGVCDYFFYETETNLRRAPLQFSLTNSLNKLAIRQSGRNIVAYINDRYVDSFEIQGEVPKSKNKIGLFFKANSQNGGIIFFQNFTLNDFITKS